MPNTVRLAPSILAADFARLGEEVRAITEAGADLIHIDVMDGHFVPNLTLGPAVVKALRPFSDLPFDVHLMVEPAEPWLEPFAEAGADILTVHPESGPHLQRTLERIKGLGRRAGVALNPATPVEAVLPVLDLADLVLAMTVNPGFGGQAFIDAVVPKIGRLRAMIDGTGRAIDLEVDGGVTAATAPGLRAAGATVLVAGTAAFSGGRAAYADNLRRLRG